MKNNDDNLSVNENEMTAVTLSATASHIYSGYRSRLDKELELLNKNKASNPFQAFFAALALTKRVQHS